MEKVTFVIRGFSGGGIESATANLVNSLSDYYHVTLIVLTGTRDDCSLHIDERVTVHFDHGYIEASIIGFFLRLGNKVIPMLGSFLFSRFLYRKLRTRYGLCSMKRVYLCGLNSYSLFVNSNDDNVVINCHSTNSFVLKERRPALYFLSQRIFSYLLSKKHVFAVSQGVQEDLVTNFGLCKSDIEVVHNIISPSSVMFSSNKNERKIIHVGNFSENKNQSKLIEAYNSSNLVRSHTLVFLGEGPELHKCKMLARKLCIENRIEFLGYVTEPKEYIKEADLIVLCSKYEGYPMVLLEAYSVGTKFLAYSELSGVKDMLEMGFEGESYYPNTVNTLSKALEVSVALNSGFNVVDLESINKSTIAHYL